MIKILSYAEIDADQWQQLLERSSVASFFQTKACYDFYAKLPFMDAFVYAVSEDGRLTGLVCGYISAENGRLKSYFSRRAIIPGGLLLDPEAGEKSVTGLLDALKKGLSGRVIYIEIRNYHDYSGLKSCVGDAGFNYQRYLNIQVPTADLSAVYHGMSVSRRRQIKQNQSYGLICEESRKPEDIRAFYDILKKLYSGKVKKPLFPLRFFEILGNEEWAHFFTVKKDGNVTGGIVCVELPGKILYEWFIAGEDKTHPHCHPSVAATWKAIEYAVDHQFRYFDFMGAGKPEEAYGVRDFKSRFGGDFVEHGRFLYICKPFLFSLGKLIVNLKKNR